VTDEFFEKLRAVFTDEEIVNLVFAGSIFNWGATFNIALHTTVTALAGSGPITPTSRSRWYDSHP
jgi:hypothetical protein